MGPDTKCSSQAKKTIRPMHAGQFVYENIGKETDLKIWHVWDEGKEDHDNYGLNDFNVSPLGQEKGDSLPNLNCHCRPTEACSTGNAEYVFTV